MSEFCNLIADLEPQKTEKIIQRNLVKLLRQENRVEGIRRSTISIVKHFALFVFEEVKETKKPQKCRSIQTNEAFTGSSKQTVQLQIC